MCVCHTDRQDKTDRQEFQTYTLLYTMLRLQNEFAYACACIMPLGRVRVRMYMRIRMYVCSPPKAPYKDTRQCVPVTFAHACPLSQKSCASTCTTNIRSHTGQPEFSTSLRGHPALLARGRTSGRCPQHLHLAHQLVDAPSPTGAATHLSSSARPPWS